MLSKIIEFLSMPFVVLIDGGFSWLSLFGVVSGLFPPVLDCTLCSRSFGILQATGIYNKSTSCQILLQSGESIIAKWGSCDVLKTATSAITKWGSFFALQSRTSSITKTDKYYKVATFIGQVFQNSIAMCPCTTRAIENIGRTIVLPTNSLVSL